MPEQEQTRSDGHEQEQTRSDGQKLTGTVKRYTSNLGYGFISVDDGEEDCFVHQSEIQCEGGGFRCLQEGTQVEFLFCLRNGKPTATKVFGLGQVKLPEFRSKYEAANTFADVSPENPESKIGCCKWFKAEKGFGFITYDGLKDVDIFVHINEIVNRVYLTPGQKVHFEIKEDGTGKYTAVNVRPIPNMSASINPYSFGPSSSFRMSSPVYNPYEFGPGFDLGMAPGMGLGMGPPGMSPGMNMPRQGMECGRIKFFNKEKGFGFIYPMDGGKELYYKIKPDMEVLEEGSIVEFRIQTAEDKQWAVGIRSAGGQQSPHGGYARQQSPHGGYAPLSPYATPFSSPGYGPPPPASGASKTGQVKFFNKDKGFGFLYPSDGSKEIYFGAQGLAPGAVPDDFLEDEFVEFNIQISDDDKIWAKDVQLISKAPIYSQG